MLYYTIYVQNLHNGTGYIDVGLEDDQLLKDYQTYLDVGLRTHKTYKVATAGGKPGQSGTFAINVTQVIAITTTPPNRPGMPQ